MDHISSLQSWNADGRAGLYWESAGCGCCSEGHTIYNKEEAISLVKGIIEEHEEAVKEYRDWLTRMKLSDVILPLSL